MSELGDILRSAANDADNLDAVLANARLELSQVQADYDAAVARGDSLDVTLTAKEAELVATIDELDTELNTNAILRQKVDRWRKKYEACVNAPLP
jgi:hypothetical protein